MDERRNDGSGQDTFESLTREILDVCAELHRSEYRLMELIRRLDALKPWRDRMVPSCAHWLNLACGIDLGTAREKSGSRMRCRSCR